MLGRLCKHSQPLLVCCLRTLMIKVSHQQQEKFTLKL
jgi:hypothetical protein